MIIIWSVIIEVNQHKNLTVYNFMQSFSSWKKMWMITSNNLMAGSPHCNWRNASPEIVCAIISRLFWRLIWCLRKNIRTNLTYGVHTTKDHFNISITLFHQLTMMTFDMKFMRKYIVYIYYFCYILCSICSSVSAWRTL